MKSGHTAEEKIKILYEDSLLEIRELTSRLESIKEAVIALPEAADKEMKRAGAETISILAAEVAKIAHRISDDSAVAERHKAFYLAAGLLSLSSTVFFSAGIFLGTQIFSWVMLSGVSLLIGIAGGMSLLVALNGIDKKAEMIIQNRQEGPEQVVDHTTLNSRWTENVFQSAAVNSALSQRTLKACRDVLVGGMSVPEAAMQHSIWTASVQLGLNKLKKHCP